MTIGIRQTVRRSTSVGVALTAVAALAACTGRGGGQLPPGTGFTGKASFGFSFTCEDKGGVNPPTGRLRIQLTYTDHGTGLIFKAPFSVHGTVDQIDPVLESMICSGQNAPPGGKELIFLGRYRATTSPPPGFPTSCAGGSATSASCRFEVIVRDNDGDLAPSARDFFSIRLSSATAVTSDLDPDSVFYARAGLLTAGNLTVK
jgi:hypothetical protein